MGGRSRKTQKMGIFAGAEIVGYKESGSRAVVCDTYSNEFLGSRAVQLLMCKVVDRVMNKNKEGDNIS